MGSFISSYLERKAPCHTTFALFCPRLYGLKSKPLPHVTIQWQIDDVWTISNRLSRFFHSLSNPVFNDSDLNQD
jgi:hypothetical protein